MPINEMRGKCEMALSKLKQQEKQIIKMAEQTGVQSNYFFVTTFKRYQVQLKILDDLEEVLNAEGTSVTKEYVKGRKNLYSNPAISAYNKTADSANKTVASLMRILKNFGGEDAIEVKDPLLEIIGGE